MDATELDSAEAIRTRTASLVEYLLAVRGLLDSPARTVPTGDTWWEPDLPVQEAVELGPAGPGEPWLSVGRPAAPADPPIPDGLVAHLSWDLSTVDEPRLAGAAVPADPAFQQRQRELMAWLDQVWRPWSRLATAATAARTLHDRLYDLQHRLDNEAARLELVWGHVILVAEVAGQRVRYPLLASPVELGYDPETTTVTVSPLGPPRLQTGALSGLDDRRLGDLLDLAGPSGQVAIDPWDAAERREFAARALRRLGLDATVVAPGGRTPAGPYVLDTGVLFVRPRQRMVRRFLAEMRTALAATGTGTGALASVLAHEPSRLALPDDDPAAWVASGQRLLMPLPTNDAQESIARRLAEHRSVAVQGPPGTGKTHTIRNLICHLVAHGKRVLVLAQKEDPLRVLRDGLPEALRPLCLAVLGRSADQLVQLQVAARELSDRAATLDIEAESGWADRMVADIDAATAELAAAQQALQTAAQRESARYGDAEAGTSASEVGAWLRREAPLLGFIPDPVPPGTPAPLDRAEFATLVDIARRVPATDRAASLGPLPTDGQLPSADQIAGRRAALRDARKVVDALADRGVDPVGVRALGEPGCEELARTLRAAADDLGAREGSWTDRLGQLVRDPGWRTVWDAHVAACQQLLADLSRRTTLLAGRRVEVPAAEAATPRQLLADLAEIRDRLAQGRKVGRLTQGDLYRLMSACLLDGEAVATLADVDLVVASVERGQLRAQLATRWAEWGTRLAAEVPVDAPEPETWAGRMLADALAALDWDRRRWPELYRRITPVYPRCESTVDARTLAGLAALVQECTAVPRADRLGAEQAAMSRWVDQVAGAAPGPGTAAAPLAALAAAWHADDLAGWDAALAEIRRLWTVRADALRFAELSGRLLTAAPQWTSLLSAGAALPAAGAALPAAGTGTATGPADDGEACLRAWRWRTAQTWFDQVVGTVDTAALGRRVEQCRDQIRRLTGELVVTSAWLSVARSLDDRKKAALADWTAALRKIGKGTGKSAAHWQAVAQQAMAQAVTAVPVWVMSIDRALEQFRGGQRLFDVVIVDEASQADIFALPVLSLAARAVVVGDDQQIGPQLVGVAADRVNALIGAHLADVPSAPHFDTESSLYDHAVRRSPQRILLTEHFRCVPAIIAFSSEHYYDGKIQPLRADAPGDIGAPVNAVFVPGGVRQEHPDFGAVNVPEAEALVTRLVHLLGEPAYAGKTIGVVSLLSTSGQADYLQYRLRAEIGPQELARRALRVGDPYTFQGDERDIVLISMVAAGDGVGAFVKRDFHRRINVAASRGRDQLWLFHSVQASQLAADDARGLLLAFATRPAQPAGTGPGAAAGAGAEALCENDVERAVLRRLHERGLHPVPQFRLGGYRIDFVLTAPDGRRLAIECDGQAYRGAEAFAADLRRQAVLERVGNATFVRLRASVFHRDPQVALAPVWERVQELGIVVG